MLAGGKGEYKQQEFEVKERRISDSFTSVKLKRAG
jgi:hypothetical protein